MPAKKAKPSYAAADRPHVRLFQRAELRAWLAANHLVSTGFWLVIKRAHAGGELTWPEIVEELLCVGFIDSVKRVLDEDHSILLCTPRKPTSAWSGINKAKVEALERAGLMLPRGQQVLDEARASGRYNALDTATNLEIPKDLADAMTPIARTNFEAFPKSTKRAILEWISLAKTPATRSKRVVDTAAKAHDNVRANQWVPVAKRAPNAGG
jgi:uncharacterized protein YdeI (YjbR/CyaY-like superfamily)